jgi:hypothetical protein
MEGLKYKNLGVIIALVSSTELLQLFFFFLVLLLHLSCIRTINGYFAFDK